MTAERNRAQENRRQLFDAAIELFRKKGFHATSADDIAARAGCSRATFFNHFGSKSAVLRFYGEQLEAQVSATLDKRPANSSPLQELRRILLVMAKEAEMHRENLKIILVHSLQDGSYFSQPSPSRLKVFGHVAALITEAQTMHEARPDLSARALAAQIIALYNNAISSVLFANQKPEDAIARLWEFVQGGLTTPAKPAVTPKRRKP